MPLNPDSLSQVLRRYPHPGCYWIAYSGGLDSHVLLHLCASLQASDAGFANFHAVHVHHGLQAEADHWAEHCATVCALSGLPFLAVRVSASARPGESPEEAARKARYAKLQSLLRPGDILLTAQHQDDQAETLLLQLLRGAGLAGLAAMPEMASLPPGHLLRPLLRFPRAQLREYAESNGLDWVEDPSNLHTDYDRNFLRHDIIPALARHWPGLGKTLARTAGHCAEAQQLLATQAASGLSQCLRPDGVSLCVQQLKEFQPAEIRWIVREWIRSRGFRMPPQVVLDRVLLEALTAKPDKNPCISWGEGEIRRFRGGLCLQAVASRFDPTTVLPWDGQGSLLLPADNGSLTVEPTAGKGIAASLWHTAEISVRYRQGGERCRLPNKAGTRELKKLLQEAGIPPWQRERLPLIYLNGELAAIADRWVCHPYHGRIGGDNIAIRWLDTARLPNN